MSGVFTASAIVHTSGGGGGGSFFVDEGFEGSGIPSGWTNNAVNLTPDYDYSTAPAPLDGSQSLNTTGSGGASEAKVSFTAQSEIWGRVHVNSTSGTGGAAAIWVRTTSTAHALELFINP